MNVRITSIIGAILLSQLAPAAIARADTLWTENAENGTAFVIDGTGGGYPLIQSNIVAEGSYAFHLAHANAQANWFALDKTLTIQPSTKLFFMSRLGYATPTQIARVQVSTDGGGTWPANIFNQPGDDGPGEGAFSLKQINLGAYASQDLRFRFYYDLNPGSYYPQTDSDVGWLIDNIQIGDSFAKLPWSIGNPTPLEQLNLEYLNRARADALAEATRLRNETAPGVQDAYEFFGITGANISNQFQRYVDQGAIDRTAQPLSFESHLLTAARLHSTDQLQNKFQGHVSSTNPPPPFHSGYSLSQRLTAVGYSFTNAAENVYAHAESAAEAHAGFDVDWGNTASPGAPFYNPAFVGQGMQNPAGHRMNVHNGDFKEVGIGVVEGTNGGFGPQVVTQDFGYSGDIRYVTGVVFDDLNNNDFYDLGEGRGGVRVDVDGSAFYAISASSGGYSVPVETDGTYSVMFSGGGFQTLLSSVTVANGLNVKLDYMVVPLPFLAGDYNNDHVVNAADYTVYRNRKAGIGGTTLEFGDNSPGVGNDDYLRWKTHFGESNATGSSLFDNTAHVPEPGTLALVGLVIAGLGLVRSRNAPFCGH